MNTTIERVAHIRALNDAFRTALSGGRVHVTPYVSDLGPLAQMLLVNAVRTYDKWDAGNDPYGEHDFGTVEMKGERFFWTIDYYAPGMMAGAENPADPENTVRVLTIMHASEY